ncbi:YheU family protein [Ferrimonas pelagia]|uniref:YheU family protein n=1 Tax=Ferrimonas pelagia TaxID=1177826 RepID=A0ABP9EYP3_9GAMM
MLIDYPTLCQSLPADTIDNLIREYLISAVGDEGFADTELSQLNNAIVQARLALQRRELVVEYSEEHESIAIRRHDDVVQTQST